MKHLVDVDDDLLARARSTLGTETIKDTVNLALRIATDQKGGEVSEALDDLAELVASLQIQDRSAAW